MLSMARFQKFSQIRMACTTVLIGNILAIGYRKRVMCPVTPKAILKFLSLSVRLVAFQAFRNISVLGVAIGTIQLGMGGMMLCKVFDLLGMTCLTCMGGLFGEDDL